MVKEYFLTYKHINGNLIRKQLTSLELDEVYNSPFVEKVVALTEINFNEFQKSFEEHQEKEKKYIMETPKP
jgi:preprotein translocase subunit SecA